MKYASLNVINPADELLGQGRFAEAEALIQDILLRTVRGKHRLLRANCLAALLWSRIRQHDTATAGPFALQLEEELLRKPRLASVPALCCYDRLELFWRLVNDLAKASRVLKRSWPIRRRLDPRLPIEPRSIWISKATEDPAPAPRVSCAGGC